MQPARYVTLSCLLIASAILATGTVSFAMPRLVREAEGVVERIDHKARTMTLRLPDRSQPEEFTWRPTSRFIQDRLSVASTNLHIGTSVNIRYRMPFFGKPYVTHIFWATDESGRIDRRH